jgi:hypothetical protein
MTPTFDDLCRAWERHTGLLQRSLAINEHLLRDLIGKQLRRTVAPGVVGRALEVVAGAALTAAAVSALAAHPGSPRYWIGAGAVAAFAAGVAITAARALWALTQLEPALPVVVLRRMADRAALFEYRALKWAVLGGVLCWLPALLVVAEAATGVPALARVPGAYLAANLALGAAAVGAGHALARRHLERPDRSPRARRVLDALAGSTIRRLRARIDELARFTAPPAP